MANNKFQQTTKPAPVAEEVKDPVEGSETSVTEKDPATDTGSDTDNKVDLAAQQAQAEEARLEAERLTEEARIAAEAAEAARIAEENRVAAEAAAKEQERLNAEAEALKTQALNTANNTVLTAAVSTNALDGGLPVRAVSFRERLFAYMEEMAPGKAIDPVVGGRVQASFYNLVLSAFKDSDVKTFMACMEILKAAVASNRESHQVFSPRYATRFAANFAGGADAMRSWTYLWAILHAVSSSDAKLQMRQIDWTVALGQLTDEQRVRVQQYFSERS
jgi:hypothetical protein